MRNMLLRKVPCGSASLIFICLVILLTACTESGPVDPQTNEYRPVEHTDPTRSQIRTRATTAEAFTQTLYPLLTQNCSTCHTTAAGVAPFFADPELVTSLSSLIGPIREMILLRDMFDMKYSHIAEITDNSVDKVKNTVAEARLRLYENLSANKNVVNAEILT